MIWCAFLSIVIPLFVSASLRSRKTSVKNIIINGITAVFQPIILHYRITSAKLIRHKVLTQNDVSLSTEFDDITNKIKLLEKELTIQNRIQFGTETVFQLVGNVILLFYAYSNTKTTQGLTALFQQDSVVLMNTPIPSKVVLSFLLTVNMASYIWFHFKSIVQGYGTNYRLIGKLMLMLCITCSCFLRIMSITLFFAPALGLFNLLHHYQGTYLFTYLFMYQKLVYY